MTVCITWGRRRLPIWCFDVEARPGPWVGSDFTFKSMLSLASKYEDRDHISYLPPGFSAKQLESFVVPIRRGVLVVTHNGDYDLPLLSGTLMKMGLDPLPRVLFSDTYKHLPKRGRAFSASLGNLSQRFDISAKGHMSEVDWDNVYAGEPKALKKLREYNIGDVISTLELRRVLIARGLLGPARVWNP